MSEPGTYSVPPIPAWLEGVLPTPEYQVQFLKGDKSVHWASNPGPQTWLLLCPYDEALVGGRRGGSKSSGLIAWFAMGDMSLAPDDPARFSFLNEPSFRGLVLRKEYQSMSEFVDEAHDFFRPFGVKVKDDPAVFEFKSGAKIYTNHLGDKEAYEKYRGHGITKIGIEELTQIPEERWYLKLLGSLRNKKQVRTHIVKDATGRAVRKSFPALRCQIMGTANPDGAGKTWVKKRFVKVYSGGKLIQPNSPMRDPISGLTRIFIPMRREDNPYLRDNKQYESMLMAQDEVTRKQWMEGDWDAEAGAFFGSFRPDGPITDTEKTKYPWARHVIDSVELKPWWFRFGGCDIGYEHLAVAQKACRNEQDGRIHVYDELAVRHVGSYELGTMVAKWWLPDLEFLPDKQITIALSPDAFSKTDASRTRAEQMEDGIKAVLGPYGAFLLRYNDDERAAMGRDPKIAQMMFEQRRGEMARGQLCIALKPAQTDRIAGWSYMRDLLRFHPILRETQDELKARLQSTFARAGVEAYEKELAGTKREGNEVLPKVLFWARCREAIRGISEAMHADPPRAEDVRKWDAVEGMGGDDGLDTCLSGDTLIATANGDLPLKDVRAGDKVWTRQGLRRVAAAGITNQSASVLRVEFSNGAVLVGTGNHPIYVKNRGFVPLEALRYADVIESWSSTQLSSTELSSEDTQNRRGWSIESTIRLAEITARRAFRRYIRKYGKRSTVPFRMGFTSTIKTKIHAITTSSIWNASWDGSICMTTHSRMRTAPECGNLASSVGNMLRLGTVVKRVSNGIASTAEMSSPEGQGLNCDAKSAGHLSRRPIRRELGRVSVRTIARLLAGVAAVSTISREIANVAGFRSQSINTPRKDAAQSCVLVKRIQSLCEKRPVYNLTVDEVPEYYANGVLVHNCRYLLMSYKDIASVMPKSYWINDQISQAQQEQVLHFGHEITDTTRLAMISMRQSQRYDRTTHAGPKTFNLPRASSSRHRVN